MRAYADHPLGQVVYFPLQFGLKGLLSFFIVFLCSHMNHLRRAFEDVFSDEDTCEWTDVGFHKLHSRLVLFFPKLRIEQVTDQWDRHRWQRRRSFTWSDIQSLFKVWHLMPHVEASEEPPVRKEQTSMMDYTYQARRVAHSFREDIC